MTSPAIVVVGSIHYDIFVNAPHRPAAGETVTGQSWHPKFGGKGGNQAVSAARSGSPTRLVSAVGQDDFAAFTLAHLGQTGVQTGHIARIAGAGTGMSVAISDASGDYGAVIVSGANLQIDPQGLSDDALWQDARYLVLQNEIPEPVNIAAAQMARQRGVAVCLNAAPWREMSETFLDLVDIVVVNSIEAQAMCGATVDSLPAAAEAAKALAARFECAIVTAGGSGVAYHAGDAAGVVPGEKVDVVSTHGAGDHFIGVLIGTLTQGSSYAEAVRAANLSAARHVAGGV
ncbi:ribokinase [Flavimaricola marinus]|uniref:Ribokinase n=1 Tax=Flavimaricola marinus TaxID=1819565 RepID=A0A238L9E6_9RHOB|nr:ribokinase [Flavimaricola marinus]SMY06309.1 Ribokinase [Flavimaricola marinus]